MLLMGLLYHLHVHENRYLMKNPNGNSATITAASKYSLSNDVLNESVYKSIAELKNNNEVCLYLFYINGPK